MVDIDLLTLNKFLTPDLGSVSLTPGLKDDGNTEPSTIPTAPTVMGSFSLVAAKTYKFSYNTVRYLRLGYVLERSGEYETGEFSFLSKGVRIESIDPNTYTAPTVLFTQTVSQQTAGALGVTFSYLTDSLSVSSDPLFGLAYKITSATPAVFPKIRAFIIKLLPLEV